MMKEISVSHDFSQVKTRDFIGVETLHIGVCTLYQFKKYISWNGPQKIKLEKTKESKEKRNAERPCF